VAVIKQLRNLQPGVTWLPQFLHKIMVLQRARENNDRVNGCLLIVCPVSRCRPQQTLPWCRCLSICGQVRFLSSHFLI